MKHLYPALIALVVLLIASGGSYYFGKTNREPCPEPHPDQTRDSLAAEVRPDVDSMAYWKAIADSLAADTVPIKPTKPRVDAAIILLDGAPVDSLMRLHKRPE